MRMQALQLDFLQKHHRAGWASWFLAALALALALDVCRSWYVLRAEIVRKEMKLMERVEAPRDPNLVKVSARPLKEGELAAARDTIRRLSIPWDSLFGALEAAQTERASLLSIEPDGASGTVTLTGEAKDYLAALTYVANLEMQKVLTRVYLSKHETRQGDPQRPIVFAISASWREKP